MDQSAFRNLLNKPQASGSGSGAGLGSGHARKLGSAPKRGITGHTKPVQNVSSYAKETKEKADRAAAAELKPRFKAKDPMKGRYKDRAEARRLGVENEFGDVEKLQEEFEEGGGDEEKRAFLGGDAKHSVLVKGLDRALLAQRKAELQMEQSADLDSELEALASNSKPAEVQEPESEAPKKAAKTKGEILAELKASQAASLGSKFKSIAAPVQEKKKKKKKKKVVEEGTAVAVEEPVRAEVPVAESEPVPEPSPKVKAKPKAPKFAIQIDDDTDDIFADVEEYKLGGPSDDDDDEEEDGVLDVPKREMSAPEEEMEMEVDEEEDEAPLPAKRSRSKSRSRSRSPLGKRARVSKSPSPVTFDPFTHQLTSSEDEESDTETGGRLVPLESSALPSVREFLALDTEAAKAEAKRAKKAKWRAQQGLPTQESGEGGEGGGGKKEMNEKQKLNREHQLLQNHLAAKK